MSLGNGTFSSGAGVPNNNGHGVDDKGNVQVDFAWGNMPTQPNDDRVEPALLDYAQSNHIRKIGRAHV